jgi:hypothetical protein
MELKHDLDVLNGVAQHNFSGNFYVGLCASAYIAKVLALLILPLPAWTSNLYKEKFV